MRWRKPLIVYICMHVDKTFVIIVIIEMFGTGLWCHVWVSTCKSLVQHKLLPKIAQIGKHYNDLKLSHKITLFSDPSPEQR